MKTILITGASGGLGQNVVEYLHEQGYSILATVGSSQHLNAFDHLPNVQTEVVNVVDETSVAGFLDGHKSDSIHAAILLVGGFAMGSIEDTDNALLQKMFDMNFLSAFNLVKPLIARFDQQGGGQFVLIGARPALQPTDGKNVVAYALSKTLIFELAKLINAEGKSKQITATVLVPSTIDTPTNREAMPDADTSRWVPARNLAEVIGFLLNDTGQMMRENCYQIVQSGLNSPISNPTVTLIRTLKATDYLLDTTMTKFLFFLTPFLLACVQPTSESEIMIPSTGPLAKYSFLSLGDSYTIGESVSENYRWSVQLAEQLRKEDVDVANPDIIARTGWTTAELQDAIKASGNQKTYNLVSLMIGVNNQYRGQSQDRYRTEFKELLQTSIKFAGGKATHVVVLSIPDWGASPYATGQNKTKIGQEIDQFNVIAKEECDKAGIAFVDITPLTRTAAGDNSQFASDGLHYSGKQMAQWAAKALPVVKEMMKK